jgi:hypothetical protein
VSAIVLGVGLLAFLGPIPVILFLDHFGVTPHFKRPRYHRLSRGLVRREERRARRYNRRLARLEKRVRCQIDKNHL